MLETEINDVQLALETNPALFSPNRPDQGSLAMISSIKLHSDEKLLDLGCGYGLVGIYFAKITAPERVTMVDADPVAVEVARRNVTCNQVNGVQVALSDAYSNVLDSDFTLIISNPPYHSDFAVAKRFIEGAFQHLAIGGRLFIVVKRGEWYANKMRTVFGGVRINQIGGYVVLESEKRSAARQPKVKAVPSRKHLERVAKSTRFT